MFSVSSPYAFILVRVSPTEDRLLQNSVFAVSTMKPFYELGTLDGYELLAQEACIEKCPERLAAGDLIVVTVMVATPPEKHVVMVHKPSVSDWRRLAHLVGGTHKSGV